MAYLIIWQRKNKLTVAGNHEKKETISIPYNHPFWVTLYTKSKNLHTDPLPLGQGSCERTPGLCWSRGVHYTWSPSQYQTDFRLRRTESKQR